MKKIIVMDRDRDYIANMNLYSFVDEQYKHCNTFNVCYVTDEEFEVMSKQIKEVGCLVERLPRITSQSYNRNRYLMGYNLRDNVIELSNYNHEFESHPKGRYYIEDGILKLDEEGYPFTTGYGYANRYVSMHGYRVYTTETYEKVLEHYNINNKNFVESNEQPLQEVKVLQKTKINNQNKSSTKNEVVCF